MALIINESMEDFVTYVDKNACKVPIFGDANYNSNHPYYNKLIDNRNGRCPQNRLGYEVVWNDKSSKRNIFILFNPSVANSERLDETLKNCVRISYAVNQSLSENNQAGGMVIYNCFSVRHPIIEEAINILNNNYQYEYDNNPIFKLSDNFSQDSVNIILAWGNDAKNKLPNSYYKSLQETINKLQERQPVYAYRCNKSGAKQPSHPSPRCTYLVKRFCKDAKLIKLDKNFQPED